MVWMTAVNGWYGANWRRPANPPEDPNQTNERAGSSQAVGVAVLGGLGETVAETRRDGHPKPQARRPFVGQPG
jgi:hypothetical protein